MRYAKLMLVNKIRNLAEVIINNNANLSSVLLEASINIDGVPFNAVYTVLKEFDEKGYGSFDDDGYGSSDVDYDKFISSKWDKYRKQQQQSQVPVAKALIPADTVPNDVNGLTALLTRAVQDLSTKHHMQDQQISNLVDKALSQFKPFSANTGLPDQRYVNKVDTGVPLQPEDPKKPDESPQKEEEPVENPDFYNQMTHAERSWFDKLDSNQKRQFITQHNQMQHGGNKAGYASMDHNHPDFAKVQEIARQIKERNPSFTDDAATFRAAVGLWNRQKIRKSLQKNLGDWGDKSMPDYDYLLHKDHNNPVGKILNDWCYLAGLE